MFPKHVTHLLFMFLISTLIGVTFSLHFLIANGQPSQSSGTPNILATGELRVGVRRDSGPYGYAENGKCCIGFDVDIANELATRWNKTLKLVPVQAGERIPLLASGDLDLVIAAMTHTKARDERIDFSQSYFRDGVQLLVRKDAGILDLADLTGLRVGGVISTTGLDRAKEWSTPYSFTVEQPFSVYTEAVNALISKDIDALISDGGILAFRATQYSNTLTVVGGPYTDEFYGIGVPQGDSALRELVNYTLQAMKEEGAYDRIYKKWFGAKAPFPIEVGPGEKIQTLEAYPTKAALAEPSRVDAIVAGQKVIIGVPALEGLQADLAREFAHRWLGDPSTLDLRVVTTQTGTAALRNHEIDLLIHALLPTWQADQAIDFSQTYAALPVALLAHQNTGFQQLTDLRDQALGFVVNSPYQWWVESEASRYNLQAKSFASYETAVGALAANEVAAVVGDAAELRFGAEQNAELAFVEKFSAIPYVIGVSQGDFRLRELVNFTLQTLKDDDFYDCLHQKWLPQSTPYAIERLLGIENYLPIRYQNLEEDRTCLPPSTIARIQKAGKVVVGVLDNFPPMGFINEKAEWVGFDLDLVRALAEIWGVDVEFVKVLADQRLDVVVNGEVDLVAAALTHTRERDARIDFSQNYFGDGQGLLVSKGSAIAGPLDLHGKRVGVIQGTTGQAGLTTLRDNTGLQFEIVPFAEDPAAVDALEKGSIDAFTTDRIALLQFAEQHSTLVVVGEPFSSEPYGLGLPAGDSQFRHLVDATLQQLKANGRYDQIYQQYFPGLPPYAVQILPDGKQPYTTTLAALRADQLVPTPSVIERMQRDKKLRAGVIDEFAPFGNLDENGRCCVGFDVEIIKEFAKRWLGDDSVASLELVALKTGDRVEALTRGEVDLVAAAMTHNWERDIQIDFSQTYFLDKQSLLVRSDAGINGFADLPGKRVGSATGSTSIDQIRKYAKAQGIQIDLVDFAEHKLGMEAVAAGQVDAYTTDRIALIQFAQATPDLLVVGELPDQQEPYGIGLPQNDHQFRDLVNSTLQEMQVDGTYARLYRQWFDPLFQNLPDAISTPTLEIWPKGKYVGQLGFSQAPMLYIPAGEFLRGSADYEKDEQPATQIQLGAFYLDQYEVTNRLYRECVAAERCTRPQNLFSLEERDDYYNKLDLYGNYPVIWPTWEQANQYCRFLGKRLPTEAEWEKAARGPQANLYPWGNELLPEVPATFMQRKDPVAVGTFALDVSGYRVYDLAGNVREWTADFYDPNYYQAGITTNPKGPRTAARKVVRGGSWVTSQAALWRVTNREAYNPNTPAHNLGFRCAADNSPIQLLPAN